MLRATRRERIFRIVERFYEMPSSKANITGIDRCYLDLWLTVVAVAAEDYIEYAEGEHNYSTARYFLMRQSTLDMADLDMTGNEVIDLLDERRKEYRKNGGKNRYGALY